MTSPPGISVPHLQTERLLLREYRRDDFAPFAAHLADRASTPHFTPADRNTAWRIFCSHAGMWLIQGAGWWSVEEKLTGQLVGNVGAFFREDCAIMELGWSTYSGFGGRGFASEAAAAALHHAFEIRREPTVRALISSANEASVRVAKRLGLTYDADIDLFGSPIGRYTRERGGATA